MIKIANKSETKAQIELKEIQALIETIVVLLQKNEIESALDMNIIAYERALSIDEPSVLCEILYTFGAIEDLKGNFQKAMSFFTKAFTMAQETQNNKYVIMTLNKIASIYNLYGQFKNSLDAYNEILEIIEAHPDFSYKKSVIYNNMGLSFLHLNAYDEAEKYYHLALTSALKGFVDLTADELIYPIIYGNLCEINLIKKHHEEAERFLHLSREYALKLKDDIGIAFCYYFEAVLQHEKNNHWEISERLFDQSIDLITQSGADYEINELVMKYGNQAFKAQQYEKAQELLERAHSNAKAHQYIQMEPEICETLEKIYLHTEHYQKAYLMTKRQLELKNAFSEQWEKTNVKRFVHSVNEDEENRQLEELKRSIRTMKMLAEVGQSITASTDTKQVFEIVSEAIVNILNLSAFAISLINEDKTSITQKVYDEGEYKEVTQDLDYENSFMVWCINNQKEIIIYGPKDILAYKDVMNDELLNRLETSLLKSLLFCPMYNEGAIIGGVTVQSKKAFNFSYVDLEVLRLLTSYIAIAISNIYRSQKLILTNKKLEAASRVDALTGLLNRRALGTYIAKDFASLEGSLPVTMIMLDLDYFKQYNDFYGHSKGDQCLISVSNTIQETLAQLANKNFAFRFGGDEFLMIIENCSRNQCFEILTQLFNKIKALHLEHHKSKISNTVTITAGATIVQSPLTDYTEVFSSADEALYMAKNGGRNKFEILIVH